MKITDFHSLILKRSSVRKYQDKPVPRESILKCLEAARLAPSACNVQPWRFIVVDDPDLKKKVSDAAYQGVGNFNKFIYEAPVIIVVMAERDLITNRMAATLKGIPYYLLDVGAACQQILLQAEELGIGTCWVGWFKEKPLKNLFGLSASKKIVSLITMGYPDAEVIKTREKRRKNLDQMVSFNQGEGLV